MEDDLILNESNVSLILWMSKDLGIIKAIYYVKCIRMGGYLECL